MASSSSSGNPLRLVLAAAAVIAALLAASFLLDGGDDPDGERGTVTTDGARPAPPPDLPSMDTAPPEALDTLGRPEPMEPGLDQPEALWPVDESSATILGLVVDALDQPLPDVDVGLYDAEGDYLDSSVSDDQGRFQLEWFEPLLAGATVLVEADPLADPDDPQLLAPTQHVLVDDLVPGDEPLLVRLQVAPAPWLTGIVFDVEGLPAPAASLELVCQESAWVDDFVDAWTEDDGTFAFPVFELPGQALLLRVEDLASDGVHLRGPFSLQPGERPFLEIHLGLPGTVRGRVLDASDGLGVDGVEVKALALHEQFDAGDAWDLTWDGGLFELETVEAPDGQLWVHVLPDDHGPVLVHVPDPSRELDIRVGPIPHLVGRLTDAVSGDPVPDADVTVRLLGPAGSYGEEDGDGADDEGRFDVELLTVPPGHAELLIEADGYVPFQRPLTGLIEIPLLPFELACDVALTPLPDS